MIIGVTGTNGAGKSTVVDYLTQKGFTHYSVRYEIANEVTCRGLPVNRPNLNEVATELREKNGADYFVRFYIEQAKTAGIKDFAIESIRNPGEADAIHAAGGVLFVVDADRQIRFNRVMIRKTSTDQVTFDEFVAQEDREMTSEDPNNPAKMDNGAVMAKADVTFQNNATFLDLYREIDAALARFRK